MSRVIVVLNVLYDDVYMYKSLQIFFLFCSVLLISSHILSLEDESSEGGGRSNGNGEGSQNRPEAAW